MSSQTEAAVTNGATSQPPADERPIAEGFKRIYIDVPLVPAPPAPIYERVWSYVGNEAQKFDNYAGALYRRAGELSDQIGQIETAARAASADDQPVAPNVALDLATLSTELASITYAVDHLGKAAKCLRSVRLALAAYVAEDKLDRGY